MAVRFGVIFITDNYTIDSVSQNISIPNISIIEIFGIVKTLFAIKRHL
ncbi:hypothetical protein AOH178_13320 [Helicobacter pylori]